MSRLILRCVLCKVYSALYIEAESNGLIISLKLLRMYGGGGGGVGRWVERFQQNIKG